MPKPDEPVECPHCGATYGVCEFEQDEIETLTCCTCHKLFTVTVIAELTYYVEKAKSEGK